MTKREKKEENKNRKKEKAEKKSKKHPNSLRKQHAERKIKQGKTE